VLPVRDADRPQGTHSDDNYLEEWPAMLASAVGPSSLGVWRRPWRAACRSHDERDLGGIDGHRRHLAGGHCRRDMAGGVDARTAGAAPQTVQPWTPAAPG